MNIVVVRIVAKEMLKRIPGKSESAMIIDSLGRRNGKEQNTLPRRHESAGMGYRRS